MRHHRDRIRMHEMQQAKARECEYQGAEERRVVATDQPTEQQEHAEQQGRIVQQKLPVECGAERQRAVERLMQRMIGAELPLAGHEEPTIERGHPIEGFAGGEPFGVKGAERQMKVAQVVVRVDALEEKRRCQDGQHRQRGQRQAGRATPRRGRTPRPRFKIALSLFHYECTAISSQLTSALGERRSSCK